MALTKTKLLAFGGAAAIAVAAGVLAWSGPGGGRPAPAGNAAAETLAPSGLPEPATPELRWDAMAEGSWLRVRITRKTGLGEAVSEVKYVLESRGPRVRARYGLFAERARTTFTIAEERDGNVTRRKLETWDGPSDFAIWQTRAAGEETVSSPGQSVLCSVSDGEFVQKGCVVRSIGRVREWRPAGGPPDAEPVRRLLAGGRADAPGTGAEMVDQRRLAAGENARVGGRDVPCERLSTRIVARKISEVERKAGIGPNSAATIRSREEPVALLGEVCGVNVWEVDREREEWVPTGGWPIPVLVIERWTDQGRPREVRTEVLDWDIKRGDPLPEVPEPGADSGTEPDDLPH